MSGVFQCPRKVEPPPPLQKVLPSGTDSLTHFGAHTEHERGDKAVTSRAVHAEVLATASGNFPLAGDKGKGEQFYLDSQTGLLGRALARRTSHLRCLRSLPPGPAGTSSGGPAKGTPAVSAPPPSVNV